MEIKHTRVMLNAALDGRLDKVEYRRDPVFGFEVPTSCPDVPAEVLDPRRTWSDQGAYDQKARHLAGLFIDNFHQFEDQTPPEVKEAAPRTDVAMA
jgi:phosphoenolpyruvate carboxykinase (ATP)